MLSNNNRPNVPKNLDECTQPDSTAKILHDWSERIDKWRGSVVTILVLVGIVKAVISGLSSVMYMFTEEFDVLSALTSVAVWAMWAFVAHVVLSILTVLISALSTIVQNSKTTANAALYTAMLTQEAGTDNDETANEGPAAEPVPAEPVKPVVIYYMGPRDNRIIECPECGKTQTTNRDTCYYCGAKFKYEE